MSSTSEQQNADYVVGTSAPERVEIIGPSPVDCTLTLVRRKDGRLENVRTSNLTPAQIDGSGARS